MPPRHAYWTILIDKGPTAFRARDKEDLLPTLNQLRRTNKDVELKWFARGRLWDSPEQQQFAARMPVIKRSRDWRPGGNHEDPRQRFKTRGPRHDGPPKDRAPRREGPPSKDVGSRREGPPAKGFGPRSEKVFRPRSELPRPKSSGPRRDGPQSKDRGPWRDGPPNDRGPQRDGPSAKGRGPWRDGASKDRSPRRDGQPSKDFGPRRGGPPSKGRGRR